MGTTRRVTVCANPRFRDVADVDSVALCLRGKVSLCLGSSVASFLCASCPVAKKEDP